MTRRYGTFGRRYNRSGLTSRSGGPPTLPDPDKKPVCPKGCTPMKDGTTGKWVCWCKDKPAGGARRFSGHDDYFRSQFKWAYSQKGNFLGAIRFACKSTYLHLRVKLSVVQARHQTSRACMRLLKSLGYDKKSASRICGHCFVAKGAGTGGKKCPPGTIRDAKGNCVPLDDGPDPLGTGKSRPRPHRRRRRRL